LLAGEVYRACREDYGPTESDEEHEDDEEFGEVQGCGLSCGGRDTGDV